MKAPRVYVVDGPEPIALSTNFKEPVIVLHSRLLRGSPPLGELRFIIGRELGHIRSSHTKWMVVMRGLMEAVRTSKIAPDELSLAPFLPLFKWAREAEMSADAAGLICCQDLSAAEQAIVRLAHGGTWADIGRVDVDAFLAQREDADFSKFAEVVQYWRELVRPQPFVPDRIRHLREYATSRQYQHLWE
jgi:Zn-dependent protease with chaperone function